MSINMTQEFVFENDSIESIEKILTALIPCVFREKGMYIQLHASTETNWFLDGRKPPDNKPTRVFIASLADYAGNCKDEDIKFSSYADMLTYSLSLLKSFAKKELCDKLGDGYTSWFNPYDGSTGLCYRLHHEPIGGWNKIILSAIHAYYGK